MGLQAYTPSALLITAACALYTVLDNPAREQPRASSVMADVSKQLSSPQPVSASGAQFTVSLLQHYGNLDYGNAVLVAQLISLGTTPTCPYLALSHRTPASPSPSALLVPYT